MHCEFAESALSQETVKDGISCSVHSCISLLMIATWIIQPGGIVPRPCKGEEPKSHTQTLQGGGTKVSYPNLTRGRNQGLVPRSCKGRSQGLIPRPYKGEEPKSHTQTLQEGGTKVSYPNLTRGRNQSLIPKPYNGEEPKSVQETNMFQTHVVKKFQLHVTDISMHSLTVYTKFLELNGVFYM